jgi:hypothetical protein
LKKEFFGGPTSNFRLSVKLNSWQSKMDERSFKSFQVRKTRRNGVCGILTSAQNAMDALMQCMYRQLEKKKKTKKSKSQKEEKVEPDKPAVEKSIDDPTKKDAGSESQAQPTFWGTFYRSINSYNPYSWQSTPEAEPKQEPEEEESEGESSEEGLEVKADEEQKAQDAPVPTVQLNANL